VLLIVEGIEKAIPLGLVAVREVGALISLLKAPTDPATGEAMTPAQVQAQVDAARSAWAGIQQKAEAKLGTLPLG
jgi:hypothetical protein